MSDHDHDHDDHGHDESDHNGHEHHEHNGHDHDGHEHHEHNGHEHAEGEHEHAHTFDWRAELLSMREDATHFYLDHFDWRGHTPPDGFAGPRYYEPSEDWRLAARLDRETPGAGDPVTLATSTGLLRQMTQAGDLVFTVDGGEHRLTSYLTQDQEGYDTLFVPFRDGTSGGETYGAGRYVEAPYYDDTDEVELDFNMAYNPSCVFSPAYDCPFPPPSNHLAIDIRAGERMPYDKRPD